MPLPEFKPDVFQFARAKKAVLFVKAQADIVFGGNNGDQVFDARPVRVLFERREQFPADAAVQAVFFDVQRNVRRETVCRTLVENVEIPVPEHPVTFRGDVKRIIARDAFGSCRKLRGKSGASSKVYAVFSI